MFQINHDVRAWWSIPQITFAPGGWLVRLRHEPRGLSLNGKHGVAGGQPFAWGIVYPDGYFHSWSFTLSHELVEMIVDPFPGSGDSFRREICDPVYSLAYRYHGVLVSDFVLPAWFQTGSRGPWDFLHALKGPRTNAFDGPYRVLPVPRSARSPE